MRRIVNIVLIVLGLLTDSSLYAGQGQSSGNYLKYIDEIIDNFSDDMKEKYNLHCYGNGGSMPNDVERVEVLFSCCRCLTVAEARKIEVAAIQTLLRLINSNEKIRPYLREYPFQTDRVGVTISFSTESGRRPLDGSVAFVCFAKNKIFYDAAEIKMSESIPLTIVNEKKEITRKMVPGTLEETLVPLSEETYEEALKILGINPNTN